MNKTRNGFTLVEVMIVLILLVAAFFPLLQMFSSGLLVSNEVKGTNTAIIIGQKKLETIKNLPYSSITNEAKTVVASYPAYSTRVIVNQTSTNIKDVQIVVYWYIGEGHETSVSIETLISNF